MMPLIEQLLTRASKPDDRAWQLPLFYEFRTLE